MSSKTVTLDIATPKGVYINTFSENDKISDVIAATVKAKELPSGDKYELVYNGEVMTPVTRTLESFHLPQNAKLELVATGSGV